MTASYHRRFAGSAFAAAFLLAAFGEAGARTPMQRKVIPASGGPTPCVGQRTKPTYASGSQRLRVNGGSFCIPEFGGFGGTLQYPTLDRSVKFTIRTTTQNIYQEPLLGSSGAPIVYLNIHFHAGTHFGAQLKAKGGLTSPSIQSGSAYTAFGIVAVGHLDLMFTPCYGIAMQGPHGGVLANVGELLSNAIITGDGFGVIEIYPGAQVSQTC
jgi:hypothetical protein